MVAAVVAAIMVGVVALLILREGLRTFVGEVQQCQQLGHFLNQGTAERSELQLKEWSEIVFRIKGKFWP